MEAHNKQNLLEAIYWLKKIYKYKDTETECPLCKLYNKDQSYDCAYCPNIIWGKSKGAPCLTRLKLYYDDCSWFEARVDHGYQHYNFWNEVYDYIESIPEDYIEDESKYFNEVLPEIKSITDRTLIE